jgi:hypothetical protein
MNPSPLPLSTDEAILFVVLVLALAVLGFALGRLTAWRPIEGVDLTEAIRRRPRPAAPLRLRPRRWERRVR